MLEAVFNPIFLPILRLHPFFAVAIISLLITVIITVIYKYTTDQKLMKSLKEEMKKSQDELKKSRDDPEKMLKIQKKAMEKNFEYMRHSMRSTLFTMIPILLIFAYLNSHLGFYPIEPNTEFTTTVEFKEGVSGNIMLNNDILEFLDGNVKTVDNGQATWKLRGDKGEYTLEYEFNGKKYNQDLLITDIREYKNPKLRVNDVNIKTININNEKVIAMNLFGWKIGWLGSYIILSLIFSTILRKVMDVA